jgi:uncharacterized membrane protein required for colicin V production
VDNTAKNGTGFAYGRLAQNVWRRAPCVIMDFIASLHASWVDILVLLVVVFGIIQGRRRGMSEELLDLVKWILVVLVAGYVYQPVGKLLAYYTYISDVYCYEMVYVLVVGVFIVGFSYLRPALGEKVMGRDFFGSGEYYLGMASGAFRWVCIILVLLALLNARHYSAEEIRQENAYQENNFGSIRFPTLITLHTAILENSMTGYLARTYLGPLLIQPTAPDQREFSKSNLVRSRERLVDEVMGKK